MRWRSLVGESILGPLDPTGRRPAGDHDGDHWAVAWVVEDEDRPAPSRGGRVAAGPGRDLPPWGPHLGPVVRRRLAAGLVLLAAALLTVPGCNGRVVAGTPVGPADARSASAPPARDRDDGTGRAGPGASAAAAGVEAQAILDATLTGSEPGCTAAFGDRGVVAWAGARGLADATAGTRLTPDSRFRLGSIGGQFPGRWSSYWRARVAWDSTTPSPSTSTACRRGRTA